MSRCAFLCLALSAIAGCAFHDWSGYTGGDVTAPTDGGAAAEAASDAPSSAPGDAATLDPYGKEVAADGPVLWYRFEETERHATTITDALGAHPGTATGPGTPTFGEPGLSGNGVLLDGSTTFDIGDAFDFAGKVPFTLEAWIKTPNGGADQRLFYKRDDYHTNQGYVAYLAGDLTPHFETTVQMSAWDSTPFPKNEFVHFVAVVTYASGKGNAAVYANGVISRNRGFDNEDNLLDTVQHLEIGDGVRGVLDEVAIYDKPLSQARIFQHYRAGGGT